MKAFAKAWSLRFDSSNDETNLNWYKEFDQMKTSEMIDWIDVEKQHHIY
jgi:hypothetical protein